MTTDELDFSFFAESEGVDSALFSGSYSRPDILIDSDSGSASELMGGFCCKVISCLNVIKCRVSETAS